MRCLEPVNFNGFGPGAAAMFAMEGVERCGRVGMSIRRLSRNQVSVHGDTLSLTCVGMVVVRKPSGNLFRRICIGVSLKLFLPCKPSNSELLTEDDMSSLTRSRLVHQTVAVEVVPYATFKSHFPAY